MFLYWKLTLFSDHFPPAAARDSFAIFAGAEYPRKYLIFSRHEIIVRKLPRACFPDAETRRGTRLVTSDVTRTDWRVAQMYKHLSGLAEIVRKPPEKGAATFSRILRVSDLGSSPVIPDVSPSSSLFSSFSNRAVAAKSRSFILCLSRFPPAFLEHPVYPPS